MQRGFTLTEILMTILLISIVSAVSIPAFLNFKDDARAAVTNEKLVAFKMAITGDPRAVAGGEYLQPGFEKQVGGLPSSLNDLRTQGSYTLYDPFTKIGWRGPYVSTTDAN